jgi:hypothetical protein
VEPLSHDLDRDDAQPYFVWDVPLTNAELRRLVAHPEPKVRAMWIARVMREARYPDVWRFVRLADIVPRYEAIRLHLGRARPFWDFLIEGWRRDGLLTGSP